ncbi:MAG: hypothetical protein ABI625_03895 [bacterium]
MLTSSKLRARTAIGALGLFVSATVADAQSIPSRLADSTYWRMITEMSEPDGFFRSDNLVGNEGSLQWVIPKLQRELGTGGVYLGVAPDQNFTYMLALKPSITFIVDIRRGAMLQHLLFKALFELSPTRADFLSLLFSRPRPSGLDGNSTVTALLASYAPVAGDSALYLRNFAAIKRHLQETHAFTLGPKDIEGIAYVYSAFFTAGPELTYNFGQGSGNFGGRGFGGRGMPTFGSLLLETDSAGVNHAYLSSEEGYRWLRDYQSRNLLVPVIGDFAGPKALRAVGEWIRAHDAKINAMYVSNVEQYLFMDTEAWKRYYANVATLPITDNALFIRSLSGGAYRQTPPQSPNSRSVQLVSSVTELLKALSDGKLTSYQDVITMTKP